MLLKKKSHIIFTAAAQMSEVHSGFLTGGPELIITNHQ
jgi:hypothetical protein